jgi:hypothetical protein
MTEPGRADDADTADAPRLGRRTEAAPSPGQLPRAAVGAPAATTDQATGLVAAAAAVDAVAHALAAQAAPPTARAEPEDSMSRSPLARLVEPAGAARPASASRTDDASPASRRAAPPARRRPGRPSVFWRYAFPVLMVVLVALIPTLAYVGKQTVLRNVDGKLVTEVNDPTQPMWRAITDPTPTLLLVQTDAEGHANGLTVMSLTGDNAGGLVFIPMTTIVDLGDVGKPPMSVVADKQGLEGLQKAVEGVLRAGMQEVAVVTPAQWADLVAPVGALSFTNPDDVTVLTEANQKQVIFAKGNLTLEPKDVGAYLATSSPGESDLNRLVRQKAFWGAWLRKVGTSDVENVVPGERDSGLGRFVRALATDRVEQYPLPVQSAAIPGTDTTLFVPVDDQVRPLVAKLVPFPIGAPPGARPRVRLLDGVGSLDHGLKAAPLIVEGGGQIDQIGNADTFDVPKTQLIYGDDARRADAESLQRSLGVGEIVKGASAGTTTDVTVVLGKDFAALPPRSLTVTTSPTGTATTTNVGATSG